MKRTYLDNDNSFKYASFIGDGISFDRKKIYDIITEYFDNLNFVKWKDNEEGYSLYIAKIKTYLSKDSRYLIAICKKDNVNPGVVVPLSDLYWESFQTRTLTLPLPFLSPSSYEIKRDKSPEIYVVSRSKTNIDYVCNDLNLKVTLLPVRGLEYEYSDKGNLYSALETYQTILTIK